MIIDVLSCASRHTVVCQQPNKMCGTQVCYLQEPLCTIFNLVQLLGRFAPDLCTHTHTHIYTCTHAHTYTHTYTHTRTHMHTHTHAHMHIHVHIHTCLCMHMYIYIPTSWIKAILRNQVCTAGPSESGFKMPACTKSYE